jgi:hypothetical protein
MLDLLRCSLEGLLVLRLAHRITYLTNSQVRSCSRDYWSCSLQPLTELPVLQTHVLVLPAQGVTGLAACSQDYLSCNSQARSCLLKGLLVLQPSAAHRVTCLANSRLGPGNLVLQLSARSQDYLANPRLGSLFGPAAKSTETCSRRRGFPCVSNIDNWCLRGLPLFADPGLQCCILTRWLRGFLI